MKGKRIMTNSKNISAILNATSLADLCDALNDAEVALRDAESPRKLDELVDTTSLPSFGGADLAGSSEAVSCDATHELVYGDEGKWELIERCSITTTENYDGFFVLQLEG